MIIETRFRSADKSSLKRSGDSTSKKFSSDIVTVVDSKREEERRGSGDEVMISNSDLMPVIAAIG